MSLEDYFPLKYLGHGGYSRVYTGHSNKGEVTVKLLNENAPYRLVNEFAKLTHLAGTGATPVPIEFGTGKVHYIVTEHVPGTDGLKYLRKSMNGAAYTVDDAVNILGGTAKKTAMIHAAGVVHRDCKPGNMIISEDNAVTWIDLGAAKFPGESEDETDDLFEGTVVYSSPEQLSNEPAAYSSDVFSFGSVVYEFTRGKAPFESNHILMSAGKILSLDESSIEEQLERDRVIQLDDDGFFDNLIRSCWDIFPEERPSMEQVARMFERG